MATMVQFQTGQVGVTLLLESNNASLNLTGWTGQVWIKRPNGTMIGPLAATPTTDGTAMQYVTTGSDFPVGMPGMYTIELHAINGGVTLKSSDTVNLVDSLA